MPDYPDLPPVSQDPNQPLPDVAPDSELVPYRIGRKDPGGEYQYTVGYAPRGRPAIAPPVGMGLSGGGVPDLSPLITEAFQRLPVDEAMKAVDMASRYIGQRGYMKDLQDGLSAEKAVAKWGPMLFKTGTGIPELLRMQMEREKMAAGDVRAVAPGTGLYRIKPTGPAQTLIAPTPNPVRPPTAVALVDAIQKADEDAADAAQKGDMNSAEKLRQRASLLREQAKGQEVVTGYDDQGRPIVKVGKGVGGDATVGMATKAQEKLVKYRNSMDLMNRLEDVFKPEYVGLRGVVGEIGIDRGLQQAAEAMGIKDVANKDRMDSRKLLVSIREALMREVSDDTRFSNADREEVARALPSSGVWESGANAQRGLNIVRNILATRSRNYASTIGRPQPLWSMSGREIKQLYPTAKDVVAAAKTGKLDKQEAQDALVRYY